MTRHERPDEPLPDEPRIGAPLDQPDEDGDPDFAAEHDDPTVADDQPGGPEGIREPESPRGAGGDGGMDAP